MFEKCQQFIRKSNKEATITTFPTPLSTRANPVAATVQTDAATGKTDAVTVFAATAGRSAGVPWRQRETANRRLHRRGYPFFSPANFAARLFLPTFARQYTHESTDGKLHRTPLRGHRRRPRRGQGHHGHLRRARHGLGRGAKGGQFAPDARRPRSPRHHRPPADGSLIPTPPLPSGAHGQRSGWSTRSTAPRSSSNATGSSP